MSEDHALLILISISPIVVYNILMFVELAFYCSLLFDISYSKSRFKFSSEVAFGMEVVIFFVSLASGKGGVKRAAENTGFFVCFFNFECMLVS